MKRIFSEVRKLPVFEKDFKKLLKRYKTLQDDFDLFIKTQLRLYHKEKIDNKGIFPVSDIGVAYPEIYKAVKFACKSLKGKGARSGIRIIYAYYQDKDIIEFIEIYYKGDKENEDRRRIVKYYK